MKRVLFFAISGAALAMPAAADYTVKGSVDCPDIVKEDAHEHYREYNKWWLLGYFSARNYITDLRVGEGIVGQGIDSGDLYSMALDFCNANPGKDWDDAAIHIYDILD